MPEYKAYHESSLVNSILIILIPFLFILCIDSLVYNLIFLPDAGHWLFILLILAHGIVENIARRLLIKAHAGISSWIRMEIILTIPLLLIGILLFYASCYKLIYFFILSGIQWSIGFNILSKLKNYELFTKTVNGKRGDDLKFTIRSYHTLASKAFESLKSSAGLINYLIAILFVIIFIFLLIGFKVGSLALLTYIIFILAGLFHKTIINFYLDDFQLYKDGLKPIQSVKRKRFSYAILIIFSSLILVFIIARNASILSPAYLKYFLQWLFGLFPKFNINTELLLPENYQSQVGLLSGLHSHADDIPVLFDLGVILRFITPFLIGALVISILLFIFIPLFRSNFFKDLRSRHPLRVFLKTIKDIFRMSIRFIKTFIQSIVSIFSAKHKQKYDKAKYNMSPLIRIENQPRSKKKIRQMNRVVRDFVSLIKWGERNKMPFHTSLGPKEYVQRIIIEIPRQKYVLDTIANTFEEVVFSPHLVDRQIIKTYTADIRAITMKSITASYE